MSERRVSTEKIILEYLEHLKLFVFPYNLVRIFMKPIRDLLNFFSYLKKNGRKTTTTTTTGI